MDATVEQLDILRKLQELDRNRIQSQTKLDKLPQPAQAQEIRAKLEELVGKISQIQSMQDDVSSQLTRFQTEDEGLVTKQEDTQKQINEASDYRIITNLTRDLEGMQKRRETIAFEQGKLKTRLAEVTQVLNNALGARDTLAKQEADLASEYRQIGGQLKAAIDDALSKRDALLAALPEDVATDYERILKKCKGVALATINQGRCSACRNRIDDNKFLQMKAEAPLSHCPSCGRMIVLQ